MRVYMRVLRVYTALDDAAGNHCNILRFQRSLLHGHEVENKTFARLTAYCEQMDLHNEFATVGEALEFSAKLRLPAETSAEQRRGFVNEVRTDVRGVQLKCLETVLKAPSCIGCSTCN